MHADESSDEHFHYSAVLQLSTQGEGFEGGDFVFVDPSAKDATTEHRLSPLRGRAIMFSSGWENVHYVDRS